MSKKPPSVEQLIREYSHARVVKTGALMKVIEGRICTPMTRNDVLEEIIRRSVR